MGPIDIRRLAALDMWGSSGSRLRRTIITIEFFLGATTGPAIGLLVALNADALGWQIFGYYLAAACVNYIPLSLHSFTLLRRADLERELAGLDISKELWRYTKLQVWLVVPLLFVLISVPQAFGQRPTNA
jgi:hypothetical protein